MVTSYNHNDTTHDVANVNALCPLLTENVGDNRGDRPSRNRDQRCSLYRGRRHVMACQPAALELHQNPSFARKVTVETVITQRLTFGNWCAQ